jgi:hypothetical protein
MVGPWAKFNEAAVSVTVRNNRLFTGHCLDDAGGATGAEDRRLYNVVIDNHNTMRS